MFKSLRWRLTVWFVLLQSLIYAVFTTLASFIFYSSLTAALDQELHALSAELRPSVNLTAEEPSLGEWAKRLTPNKLLATVQIYKANGALLESYGPAGVTALSLGAKELQAGGKTVRVRCRPLERGGQLAGYLQTELSTESRDDAVRQFGLTLALVAPLLLLALGAVGYLVAGKAAEPVEESFRVLRQFMGDAGHELGTPLSIMQANLEALESELADRGATSPKVAVIDRAGKRMGSLISDLMLLAKLEAPQPVLPYLPVRLDQIVASTVEEFTELYKAKELNLTCSELTPTVILGDQEALKRLVANLLQNALRYTDSGGSTAVELQASGRQVRLTVSDTGVGIAPDKLPAIFDRFYRLEESRTRAAGGAGLGLSIVKATAEAHKGKVEVESILGSGTTFTVTLPRDTLSASLHTFFTRRD